MAPSQQPVNLWICRSCQWRNIRYNTRCSNCNTRRADKPRNVAVILTKPAYGADTERPSKLKDPDKPQESDDVWKEEESGSEEGSGREGGG